MVLGPLIATWILWISFDIFWITIAKDVYLFSVGKIELRVIKDSLFMVLVQGVYTQPLLPLEIWLYEKSYSFLFFVFLIKKTQFNGKLQNNFFYSVFKLN